MIRSLPLWTAIGGRPSKVVEERLQSGSGNFSMSDVHVCQVCGGQLQKVDAYSHLPRVTSDCKPWPSGGTLALCVECGAIQKIPDAVWLDEISRIYKDYQIYQLSGGSEQ